MADLSCEIAGVKSSNPFWLASAPPTDKQYNVQRAFEAGWGGAVWKTLGESGPPIVNTCSRYNKIGDQQNRGQPQVRRHGGNTRLINVKSGSGFLSHQNAENLKLTPFL